MPDTIGPPPGDVPSGDPASGERSPVLGAALADLTDIRAGTTPATLTRRLVGYCVDLLPVDAAGVMLLDPAAPGAQVAETGLPPAGHRVDVAAGSDEALREMELYAAGSGRGPSVEALFTGRSCGVADFTAAGARWPDLTLRAVAAGYRAMWAQPMRHLEHSVGVINLYRRTTGLLPPHHQERARKLAHAATIGLLLFWARRLRAERLQWSLTARVVTEQAKGILAQRLGLPPDAAFEVLTAQALLHRSPVPDLARALAEEPDGPWPPRAPGDRPR
ncbi:GAF and ANTAR domain-containing protein [Streptomyces monomycini]|uniref:GAF and ANTAR domain-containing protein n=1 Tax=Streptomyces monomycini TaxID=371720 RepID=UPI00067BD483|nr:GAF and ANTAR domain-containing protein [Streptomyces monomycini]